MVWPELRNYWRSGTEDSALLNNDDMDPPWNLPKKSQERVKFLKHILLFDGSVEAGSKSPSTSPKPDLDPDPNPIIKTSARFRPYCVARWTILRHSIEPVSSVYRPVSPDIYGHSKSKCVYGQQRFQLNVAIVRLNA